MLTDDMRQLPADMRTLGQGMRGGRGKHKPAVLTVSSLEYFLLRQLYNGERKTTSELKTQTINTASGVWLALCKLRRNTFVESKYPMEVDCYLTVWCITDAGRMIADIIYNILLEPKRAAMSV